VGGIKEKVLASQRAGVKTVILPVDNKRDWDELAEEVRSSVDVVFATSYKDVFEVAFPEKKGAEVTTTEEAQSDSP